MRTIERLLNGRWRVTIAVLLSIAVLTQPSFSQASAGFEEDVPLAQQVPPAPSGPRPAPVQVPRPPRGQEPVVTLVPGPWQWQWTQQADGTTVTAQNPSRYILSFLPESRLSIQADCNRVMGAYAQAGSSLTFRLGATTRVGCPPGSQDQVFVRALGTTESYAIDGTNLVLTLQAGGGTMTFAPQRSDGTSAPAASASVTGTVTYRERIALPVNAVVKVSLQDTSPADAPAVLLGDQAINTGGSQVPIPFEITYDPAAIDQRLTYAVRARITVDGQLMFTSTTTTRVITQGNPTNVEIVVQRV